MRPMTMQIETFVASKVFSELSGFVLTDPAALDRFHRKPTLGLDLLSLYTTTDVGDEVSSAGAAIPVIGVQAGYYSLVVRNASVASLLEGPPLTVSSGWILQVISGTVALCGLGYLSHWNPQHAKIRHAAVPSGWYQVEIWLGKSFNDDDFALEFILSPCAARPPFTADLTRDWADTD